MSTAFIRAHLITGDGRDFDSAAVLVENGRIASVNTRGGDLAADVVVDLKGRALLPGFIDLHDHMIGGDNQIGHGDEYTSFKIGDPIIKAVLDSVEAAAKTLHVGVTSAREIGARDFIDVAMKRAQAAGQIQGPRMLAAGPGVWMSGGHGSFWQPGHGADGVDAVICRVRYLVENNVDVVKVVSSDGPETCGDWWSPQYTPEEAAAAMGEAKRLGRRTAAHAMGHDGINNLVTGGAETIEHGWYISEENCRTMIQHGTYLIPTLGNVVDIIHKGAGLEMPWAVMMQDDEEAIFQRHSMAVELGVNIAMGSDCGGNEARLHGDNLLELDCHVRCGMSPMQAITSGTLDAARAVRIDNEVGSVAEGKLADFVIVDGDPLADIRLTQTGVVGVVQGGAVKRDDLGILEQLRREPGTAAARGVLLGALGAFGRAG